MTDIGPVLAALMTDHERLVGSHVKDGHHEVTADRVGLTDGGDTVPIAASREQFENPLLAGKTPELAFELLAHRLIGVLGRACLAREPRDEEGCHSARGLEATFASVLAQCDGE